MLFTILSIALAGLGLEGIVLAVFLLMCSGTVPVHFPLTMTSAGCLGIILSLHWRRMGVAHLHYASYDAPGIFGKGNNTASEILLGFIREIESSTGYARNDVRAKAKDWLIHHVSSLDEEDILLARAHFGYLLPAGWGLSARTS